MWISVVLIIMVIVIGLIAGSRLSAPGPQRRAVNASFISLAVMALLFFILINAFPGDWIVPFFTVACIVVPICIYVGFTRAAVTAEKTANKKSFEIPRAVMTWDEEDSVSAFTPIKATTASAPAPVAETKTKAEPSKAKPATQPKPDHKIDTPKPEPAAAPAASKAEEKPAPKAPEKPAAAVQSKPKVEPTPKPAAKPEPKPEPKVTKAPETAATPKPEKPVQEAAPAKVEKPAEAPAKKETKTSPAPASAPAPAPSPAPAPEKPQVEPKVAKDIQASLTAKSAESAATRKPAPEFTAAASADLLSGKPATDEAPSHKSLLTEIEALVERDLNVGRKIAEGASDEEVRAAEAAPLNYHTDDIDIALPSSLQIPTTEPAAKPEAPTLEATPAPTPAPKPKPEPKPEPLDPFTELCNKAASLRDQGSYAVAAVIFKKAADAAPSANDARSTQFDELSCYVKAGETTKAKALAAQLRQSSVLTRFERIKLDAVERMG